MEGHCPVHHMLSYRQAHTPFHFWIFKGSLSHQPLRVESGHKAGQAQSLSLAFWNPRSPRPVSEAQRRLPVGSVALGHRDL